MLLILISFNNKEAPRLTAKGSRYLIISTMKNCYLG